MCVCVWPGLCGGQTKTFSSSLSTSTRTHTRTHAHVISGARRRKSSVTPFFYSASLLFFWPAVNAVRTYSRSVSQTLFSFSRGKVQKSLQFVQCFWHEGNSFLHGLISCQLLARACLRSSQRIAFRSADARKVKAPREVLI